MNRIAAMVMSLAVGSLGPAADPAPAWLAGCWRMSRGSMVIDEQWLAPLGGMMLGSGRTVRGGSVLEYEFVVLRSDGAGLSYEAHPSGQDVATFRAPNGGDPDEVIFENPTHDFPQRVAYKRLSADSMLAWIDGTEGGTKNRIEFPYARVSCEPPKQ